MTNTQAIDIKIEKSAENVIGQLIRQGVYFEQMVDDLHTHFHRRGVTFIYHESEWRVFRRKDTTTRKLFTSFAQAIDYAYELALIEL